MADIELILLQRVPKLGQMGERVRVKPGYARNFLLPQKKALRATKENAARFEHERVVLEAQNIKRREEAERLAERVAGLSVVIIRQAGESGQLYGSVSARDIADAVTGPTPGMVINRLAVSPALTDAASSRSTAPIASSSASIWPTSERSAPRTQSGTTISPFSLKPSAAMRFRP